MSVLAGIAASDAACCARLGKRARGQDHAQAVDLLASVVPGGVAMAHQLNGLLAAKDESHYGLQLVTRRKAASLLRRAQQLTELSALVVES